MICLTGYVKISLPIYCYLELCQLVVLLSTKTYWDQQALLSLILHLILVMHLLDAQMYLDHHLYAMVGWEDCIMKLTDIAP